MLTLNLKSLNSYIKRYKFWKRYSQAVEGFHQINFLHAAATSGLLQALIIPANLTELAARLNTQYLDLLEIFCELGVETGFLEKKGDSFRLRSDLQNLLLTDSFDPILAYTEEIIMLQAPSIRKVSSQLTGISLVKEIERKGDVIARSSVLFESVMKKMVKKVVPPQGQIRILEVGCGSGIYLRYAAERNPQITGIALDREEGVIKIASENLHRWGVADKFHLYHQDIFEAPNNLRETFDLITLYNNIYYFAVNQRLKLFTLLRGLLASGGKLAITSVIRAKNIRSVTLDISIRALFNGSSLPVEKELIEQLYSTGFHTISTTKLNPDGSYIGIITGMDNT